MNHSNKEHIFYYLDTPDIGNCRLCSQFVLREENNLFHKIYDKNFSPVIKEYKYFIWGVGLGQISEGYSLLIPKRHIYSISTLNEHEFKELEIILREIHLTVSNVYGIDYIMFEHGGSLISEQKNKSASCINHAHMHILPNINFREFHNLISSQYNTIKLENILCLKSYFDNYSFYSHPAFNKYYLINDDKNIESQFFRKVASKVLSCDNWDWQYFIGKDLMSISIVKLRRSLDNIS